MGVTHGGATCGFSSTIPARDGVSLQAPGSRRIPRCERLPFGEHAPYFRRPIAKASAAVLRDRNLKATTRERYAGVFAHFGVYFDAS